MMPFKFSFKVPFSFLWATIAIFILAGCERFCPEASFSFSSNWSADNLDNSGASPVLSTSPIPKTAYGLRVANTPTFGIQTDPNCDEWYLSNPVQQIKIYTARQFDGKVPGTEITERFMGRLEAAENGGARHTTYKPVGDMLGKMNYPSGSQLNPFYLDFVLIEAPASADTCQFRVEFVFADSSIVNIYTPKIFLQ